MNSAPHKVVQSLTLDHLGLNVAILKKSLDERYDSVVKSCRIVVDGDQENICFHDVFDDCELLCREGFGNQLFESLRSVLNNFLISQLDTHVLSNNDSIGISVVSVWDRYNQILQLFRRMLIYLDLSQSTESEVLAKSPIFHTGYTLFRSIILNHRNVTKPLIEFAITELRGLRDNSRLNHVQSNVNTSSLHSVLDMFMKTKAAMEILESAILLETTTYYKKERAFYEQLLSQDTLRQANCQLESILLHINSRLVNEAQWFQTFMSCIAIFSEKVVHLIELHLLKDALTSVILPGMNGLLEFYILEKDTKDTNIFSLAYALLYRINALDSLKTLLATQLRHHGVLAFSSTSPIDHLLNLKAKFDVLLMDAFSKNESFSNTFKEVWETIMRSSKVRPAELLALYMNDILQKEATMSEDEETNFMSLLEQCLGLFRFISQKDQFESYYKRSFAGRLLHGSSTSLQAEKKMLQSLKSECGSQFTFRLEGMLKDMDVSEQLEKSFKSDMKSQKLVNLDIHVYVLTMSHWPQKKELVFNLPPALSKAQKAYEGYYLKRFEGRKLMWQREEERCIVLCSYLKKEFEMSLIQASVMDLFGHIDDHLDYSAIKTRLAIKEETPLKTALHGLVSFHLLERIDNVFSVNKLFSHPSYRVKIGALKETPSEQTEMDVEEKSLADRFHLIDAAIVRKLKADKSSTYADLKETVNDRLRVNVSDADMKRRMDNLVDREFIMKDEKTPTLFHYKP